MYFNTEHLDRWLWWLWRFEIEYRKCKRSFQEESGALQLFTAETIKSVLRTERNQQMMSDVNFMSAVLATCRYPSSSPAPWSLIVVVSSRQCLEDEASLLYSPFQYLLERLAAQKLQPDDLRYSWTNNKSFKPWLQTISPAWRPPGKSLWWPDWRHVQQQGGAS